MIDETRCPHCGHRIDKRQIVLFSSLVKALWHIYKVCKERGIHEFKMSQIRHLLGKNEYARFGDWVMFGGLVYKVEKAHYGLNMKRCAGFFSCKDKIPTVIWKDGLTGELTKENYKDVMSIPKLKDFLDADDMYVANYKL